MKANSKIFFVLTTLLIVMPLSASVCSAEHIENTPTPESGVLKWATQIGEGWQKSAGEPIIVDDRIMIMARNEILALDKETGEIIKTAQMAEAQSYGYVAPTYAEGHIFMNLSNGTIESFNAKTLESEWVYKHTDNGKGMTAVTYSDNMIFTGFWNGEKKDGDFVALDSCTGELKWSKTIDGGLYWAGAYCTDNAVIFGTDDGADAISHIYSCNKETGEVLSCIDVESKGDIRSSVSYYSGRIYATTKGGYLISAALNGSVLSDVMYGEIGSASTSTPVIYKDRVYIGAGDKSITVFNALTLEKLFSVPVAAYPQCTPLISNYYEESGYLYLYTTYNKTPGGITLIKIKTDAISEEDCIVTELYDAKGYEQYCIANIICDENGTLYYKNDSGYLFAFANNVSITVSFAEEGFIYEPTKMDVEYNTAENYGYSDMVTDNVSALDALVKIHEIMLEDAFSAENANDYLIVSPEGYLSRVMGIDTYNFGFAVNGTAPHDDVLTQYGYNGYSLNQAPVKNSDKVEFFIYRDSWAMDNYCVFSTNDEATTHIFSNAGEELEIKVEGFAFGWYSCAEEATIKENTFPLNGAEIFVNNELYATTNSEGIFKLSFDKVGRYTIFVKEGDNSTPIIPAQIEVDVIGCEVVNKDNKFYLISDLTEETNAWVIIAYYNSDEMITAKTEYVTLPKGYNEMEIKTVNTSNDIKVFAWNKSMSPLAGGIEK